MTKRLFDLVLTGLTAPFWGLIVLVLALVVRRKLGSPVFFRQKRPGLHGEIFDMIKFRTMTDQRDEKGELLPDAVRLTAFGKWLRSTSLDELPELILVLTGKMSLVGPRPLLVQYLKLYTPEQARRHEARPGITGWAQINGRNAISWDDKFKLDVWYVDHQSVWLDIKILFLTIYRVFNRHGISASNDATMPVFTGSQNK